MKLVRPTYPPSMAVLVDSVLDGEHKFTIPNSDVYLNRIDAIYVERGALALYVGTAAMHPMAPKLQGRRLLATIYVPRRVTQIKYEHITETI